MQWHLRMRAAERGIWKSTDLRRKLADAGLEISAGKMSGWWTGTPNTIKFDDLDVICSVLDCDPTDLMTPEPEKVAQRRPDATKTTADGTASSTVAPRFNNPRSAPPV
jgi:putative transcriptional regulator